jgi:hypothetical protein
VYKSLGTLAVATVACAQVAAVTSRRRAGDPRAVGILYVVSIVLVAAVSAMACAAMWAEIDDENFYRVLAALVVADVFSVILQPILQRMAPPRGDGAHRIVFTLDREPTAEAVQSAREAFERSGAAVERWERGH